MLYLDCAATSFPKPQEVIDEVIRCITEYCGNPGRSGHELSLRSAEQIFQCRCEICSFFHFDKPEHVVFVSGATEGINLAVSSFLREGSHVLISDMEHNATLRTVHGLCRERHGTYGIFSHKGEISKNLQNMITPKTRMVVCTEASNVTGEIFPIKEIGEICRDQKIDLIIDGAQGAGHADTVLKNVYFSAYCASAHKALYGLQGAGFVILGRCPPHEYIRGGTGIESIRRGMPTYLPERFEAGTPPTPAIVSLAAGIRYLCSNPQKSQVAKLRAECFHRKIKCLSKIKVYSEHENPCGIVSFSVQGQDSSDIAEQMNSRGICVRGGLHCAPLAHQTLGTLEKGLVRASFGIFHSQADVDFAANVIKQITESS